MLLDYELGFITHRSELRFRDLAIDSNSRDWIETDLLSIF